MTYIQKINENWLNEHIIGNNKYSLMATCGVVIDAIGQTIHCFLSLGFQLCLCLEGLHDLVAKRPRK